MKLVTSILVLLATLAANAATKRKEGDFAVIVSAEKRGESVAFVIDTPIMPRWISYGPGFKFEHLQSATVEGQGLSLPLRNPNTLPADQSPCVFILPKSVLKGAVLKLEIAGRSSSLLNPETEKREIALEALVNDISETDQTRAEQDNIKKIEMEPLSADELLKALGGTCFRIGIPASVPKSTILQLKLKDSSGNENAVAELKDLDPTKLVTLFFIKSKVAGKPAYTLVHNNKAIRGEIDNDTAFLTYTSNLELRKLDETLVNFTEVEGFDQKTGIAQTRTASLYLSLQFPTIQENGDSNCD